MLVIKNRLNVLILCLLLAACCNQDIVGQNTDLSLKIEFAESSTTSLICTVVNKSEKPVRLSEFDGSDLNRVQIYDSDSKVISHGFTFCTGQQVVLQPKEIYEWEYDLKPCFYPKIIIRDNKPKPGSYTIIWTVNGIQSEPFFYKVN